MPGPGYKLTPKQVAALAASKRARQAPITLAAAENALKTAQDRERWVNKSYKELTWLGIPLNSFIIRNDKNNNVTHQFKGWTDRGPIFYDGQPSFILGGRSKWAEPFLTKAKYNEAVKDARAAVASARAEVTRLRKNSKTSADAVERSGKTTTTTPNNQFIDRSKTPAEYNIGTVSDAYFNGKTVTTSTGDAGNDNSLINDWRVRNKPSSVKYASELWKKGINSKGMIQTWMPPAGMAVTSTVMKDNKDDKNFANFSTKRFGFQFMYNPSSVGMTFGGVPNVDLSWIASGQSQTNIFNPEVSQSTVGFEVLINRIPDMNALQKYLDSSGKVSTDLVKSVQPHPKDAWSGRKLVGNKTSSEHDEYTKALQSIKDNGTMYDVEFLLKTLLGIEGYTTLRPGVKTADLGFLAPKPVELHLGKSLRYLVYISKFSINHVIFDENMVPMFTTLRIEGNRVPDITGSNS
jgi:hypothetical protein